MIQAKKKAIELFEYYDELLTYITSKNIVKQCVLKAIEEIKKQLIPIEKAPNNKDAFNYWNEVEQEVKKL